jgi:regulator of extracellular matrix RemA (YlzA/DUF370 family)
MDEGRKVPGDIPTRRKRFNNIFMGVRIIAVVARKTTPMRRVAARQTGKNGRITTVLPFRTSFCIESSAVTIGGIGSYGAFLQDFVLRERKTWNCRQVPV